MRIGDLHTVNLDEDEVIKFVGTHSLLESRDDFADRGRLAGSRRARDVDAVSNAIGDGGLKMGVNQREFAFSAGETGWDGGNMESRAGYLKW